MLRRAILFFLLVSGAVMTCPTPSWSQKALGQACTTHQECRSLRCDNRPGAGCVAQDGTGNAGEFCTTHQQCRTGLCAITPGKFTGTCSGGDRALGQPCSTHQECRSGRCDNRPGAGCVGQDGTGEGNAFCTTHQQCHSGFCNIAAGRIAGQCTGYNRPLGAACVSHGECQSLRCDNRLGAGCVPQDTRGEAGQFCTTHQQCRSVVCQVTGGLRGTCSTYNRRDGESCQAMTQCASRNCRSGVCGQAAASPAAPNPYHAGLAAYFAPNSPNRTLSYRGSSSIASPAGQKVVITAVKNSSNYAMQLTMKDRAGALLVGGIWVQPGESTGAFNGKDANAAWEALGPESGAYVSQQPSLAIEISWR